MPRDFHFHPIKIFDMSFILNSNLNLISLKRKTWLDRRPVCAIIEVVWNFGQYSLLSPSLETSFAAGFFYEIQIIVSKSVSGLSSEQASLLFGVFHQDSAQVFALC